MTIPTEGRRGLTKEGSESETQSAESQQTISMSKDPLDDDKATATSHRRSKSKQKNANDRTRASEGSRNKGAAPSSQENRANTNEGTTTSDRISPDSDDETHQEKFNRVQRAREAYISLPPGEMMKARGEKLLVIQPGSQVLRIGLAGDPDFVEVPNCIAHRKKTSKSGDRPRKRQRGVSSSRGGPAVGGESERDRQKDESARRAGCSQIESLLSFGKDGTGSAFMEQPELTLMKDEPKSKEKLESNPEEVTTLFGEKALEGAKSGEFDLYFCMHNGHLHDHVTPVNILKRHLHDIWWWVICTHLKITKVDLASYSCVLLVSSVMHKREIRDMVDVVLRDLGMQEIAIHRDSVASMFTHGCQVACVANVDTHFTSIVCIEDGTCMPNSKIILPYGRWDILDLTRSLLEKHDCWPYGKEGQLESKGFDESDKDEHWIRTTGTGFTCVDEFKALGEIFTKCCKYVPVDDENATASKAQSSKMGKKEGRSVTLTTRKKDPTGGKREEEKKEKEVEHSEKTYKLVTGYTSLVAPMALYIPQAFGLSKFEKARRKLDHVPMTNLEDSVDGFMLDAVVSKDPSSSVLKSKRLKHQLAGKVACGGEEAQEEEGEEDDEEEEKEKEEAAVLGIDQAIVKSILSTNRPDLKNRLFQNIVLVGDFTCELPGCIDVLETRLLRCLPEQEDEVNTVNVVQPKVGHLRETIFRGGALLGVLDWVQENWIQRKEWTHGGVHVGSGKKLSRINKLSLQMLWNGVY